MDKASTIPHLSERVGLRAAPFTWHRHPKGPACCMACTMVAGKRRPCAISPTAARICGTRARAASTIRSAPSVVALVLSVMGSPSELLSCQATASSPLPVARFHSTRFVEAGYLERVKADRNRAFGYIPATVRTDPMRPSWAQIRQNVPATEHIRLPQKLVVQLHRSIRSLSAVLVSRPFQWGLSGCIFFRLHIPQRELPKHPALRPRRRAASPPSVFSVGENACRLPP